MPDLFDTNLDAHQPLARRLRPRSLDEFVGQAHALAEGRPLDRLIRAGHLTSILLFGPPGTGKTAFAHLLARIFAAEFVSLNAVTSGVADIRAVSAAASQRLKMHGTKTLLFIDEIHRFNKAQQDALLPDVEEGRLIILGATTHNPSFYITSALASRSTIVEFKPLDDAALITLLRRALADSERGLGSLKLTVTDKTLQAIVGFADGDARRALNALEVLAVTAGRGATLDLDDLESALGRKAYVYDRAEDSHYDHASAFIKSMRGSDPDAAVYYLARMIEGGEDPRFIARRMAILASEDIGNADPRALTLAVSAHQAVEFVGLPEARIILAQCAVYLAVAPKSNAAYVAIDAALADIRSGKVLDVPISLRGTGYRDAEKLGRGEGYEYAHDHGGFVKQDYLSEPRSYYRPTESGQEKKIREWLAKLWGRWPRSGR